MLKSALLIGAGIVVGAGAIQGLHAASGPTVLTTYEANIKDEAGYTAALPEVEKYIKDNGGQRLAGGFNKAKLIDGTGAVGNRYVIVSWPNAAAFEKAQSDGLKAWIDKHGNGAREQHTGRARGHHVQVAVLAHRGAGPQDSAACHRLGAGKRLQQSLSSMLPVRTSEVRRPRKRVRRKLAREEAAPGQEQIRSCAEASDGGDGPARGARSTSIG